MTSEQPGECASIQPLPLARRFSRRGVTSGSSLVRLAQVEGRFRDGCKVRDGCEDYWAGIAAQVYLPADQALKILALQPIDVVITDLRMPGMDGMALLNRITGEWPGVPVILLTAHASIQLAVEAMSQLVRTAQGQPERTRQRARVAQLFQESAGVPDQRRGAPSQGMRRREAIFPENQRLPGHG